MRPVSITSSIGILYVILASAACSGSAETAPPAGGGGGRGGGRGGAAGPVPIAVGKVVQKPMPVEVQAIGTVEPARTVTVRAQITGELTSVNFKEGDDVQAGQVLFSLDRRPFEAALKQAEANLARDVAQAENAAAQAKRTNELAERGIATREQVGTANSGSQAAEAIVGADRAAIDNARVQLQYATIAAPITGRTGTLMVHPGNLVRANDTTPLVVINQLAPINVSFAVPEAQLTSLKRYLAEGGVHVNVQQPGESAKPVAGRIAFIDNSVDPTTGTIKVKGVFENVDHRLWPGQYVNVIVTLATDSKALVVPTPAVQQGPQGTYVYVIKPDQTADLRPVKVGRTNGDQTIITDGVTEGETIVTDGHLRLVPGSRVSIKNAAGRGAE
jgi:multidrug efflux system membrane fusion protein